MSHYEIDYSSVPDSEKATRCVNDCREYMGEKYFASVVATYRGQGKVSLAQFVMHMAFFSGIEGEPVLHLYNHIYSDSMTMEQYRDVIKEL